MLSDNHEKTDEIITVLGGAVRLYQLPQGGFRTSLDSVMLASACPAQPGQKVLDMGCGVGGATFCLLHRVPELHVTGVEWEKSYYETAVKNAPLNNRVGQTTFVHADIRDYSPAAKPVFDHVIVNPPYREAGHHTASPDPVKAQALGHQQEDLTLEDWIKAAHRLLKSGGSLTMIYPTSGLDRIILGLGKKFGATEIIPLWPRQGESSKRLIIRTIKDRKTPCQLRAGLVLHQGNGEYTSEAEAILRDAKKL